MAQAHKNFAYSLVATQPSPQASGTSLIVTAGQGALFPAVPFNATVWPASTQPLSTNAEIVTVTVVATDTFTIVRQMEGTSARTIGVGDQIAATITAGTLRDVEQELAPAKNVIVQPGFSSYKVQYSEVPAGYYSEVGLGAYSEVG